MDQTIDIAVESYEDTEISDRLDFTGNDIAFIGGLGEFFPRVAFTLLHTQRYASTFLVDFKDNHFDFITKGNDFIRVDIFVCPVHFRNVNKTFDTVFNFDKTTIIGDITDMTKQSLPFRITPHDVGPWVITNLLEAERHAVLFTIKLEHNNINFLADFNDFGRMLDALPGHIGDV